jgi:ankyrin repeat protein
MENEMLTLSSDHVVAIALVQAIRGGEIDALRRLIDEHPELASARLQGDKGTTRTPLHVAADWPGYFPNGPAVVDLLIGAGGDPNAPVTGSWHAETPLHWAASSDDVDVASALIAGGAEIEATGASIGGGTPLDDAVGYGCWHVARLLVERGARVERLWHAAALGMRSRVEELLAGHPPPTLRDINNAFWQACHGGQRRVADYLLAKGADINWVPDYTKITPLDAAGSLDTRRDTFVTWLREQGAKSAKS